ncbi:MAG: SPOR domain-containing protein, partial [Sphingomonadales bacterium]
MSQPVVQALPSRQSLELNAALSRLAREPRNVDALVDAGNAASALGDFEAAVGFFRRGQQISPQNPRLLAGLAGALAHHGDPVSAIRLFSQAESAGASAAAIAADRGLAYDLAGDAAKAQRYYQMALGQGSYDNDEVRRRLGISYAISGDASNSEKTLTPLLHKQDKAAWRARAFALAIQGESKEAIKITRTLLPARLAESISPYMQYMPRLTSAQQAAAANLGVFPRASDIGRDGTAIASFGSTVADSARVASVDRALVPTGQPLGAQSGAKSGAAASSARSQPKPTRADRLAAQAEAR